MSHPLLVYISVFLITQKCTLDFVMIDAGTQPPEFYTQYLSLPRLKTRQWVHKNMVWESAFLANLQNRVRTPFLDTYFALTANIGAHTFYMIMLPLFFWFNNIMLGMNVIWVLAAGVAICGILKDYLCLPRPTAPPVHRISMSKGALEEYGLPSTHSCNAVSVALVFNKYYPNNRVVYWTNIWLVATLVFGRLYNGMHGFADISTGIVIGYFIYKICNFIVTHFSHFNFQDVSILSFLLFGLIYINPVLVEACPCFEDTIAFCAVVSGMMWTLYTGVSDGVHFHADSYTDTTSMTLAAFLRFAIGATAVVLWRVSSKKVLTKAAKLFVKTPLSADVIMWIRLTIYFGIAPIVLIVAPEMFKYFNL